MTSFKLNFTLLLLSIALNMSAKSLRFNKNGEFKIVQFTDMHIDYESGYNDPVFDLVKEIVGSEHPDLVMLTGDISVKENPTDVYLRFDSLFAKLNVPWAVVFGNHDIEFGTSGQNILKAIEALPHCLTSGVRGLKGSTNFVIPVKGSTGKTAAVIYGMDSNSGSTIPDRVGGYDWFGSDQITWYKKISTSFARKNKGNPLPSLAFFHIPFTEYNQAWENKASRHFGVKNENVSCPELNSGMFTAMVDCNDVMGTFVGHDHVNDYIGITRNIALAFGRCSGGENAYGDLPDGGRVIVLKEGKRMFDTWIHEKGGNLVYRCTYPDSFVIAAKK